jgi:THO complex subunit 2
MADLDKRLVLIFQASGDLPVSIPSLTMSLPTLQGLGLLGPHNESTFNRAQVRRQTALGYKQSKYNLLRESSEGFSGLIVLLTSGDALADDALNESAEATKARAKRVWSKVMGLIGYFNLSPPRVLDIILEIASCQVTIHWRFWLELIRCSPWGGADKNGKGKEKAEGSWAEQELQAVAGALDWEGDRVLAQVLGAKFSFCQVSTGRHAVILADRSATGRWEYSERTRVYCGSLGQARLCRTCRSPAICVSSSSTFPDSSLILE